eukprot:7075497-Pyramimonas_sp.AAC.1
MKCLRSQWPVCAGHYLSNECVTLEKSHRGNTEHLTCVAGGPPLHNYRELLLPPRDWPPPHPLNLDPPTTGGAVPWGSAGG